jgi:DNA gyrase/topoisomerase IV subunit A
MTSWIEWRKEIETKMTKRELELTIDKEYRLKTKESAVQNLSVIKDALEDNNPVNYIVTNLPYLKTLHTTNAKLANELAEYLMDQKLTAIRKLDLNKLQKELVECQKKTANLNADLADISKVVLRELDKLKVFYKARTLKV